MCSGLKRMVQPTSFKSLKCSDASYPKVLQRYYDDVKEREWLVTNIWCLAQRLLTSVTVTTERKMQCTGLYRMSDMLCYYAVMFFFLLKVESKTSSHTWLVAFTIVLSFVVFGHLKGFSTFQRCYILQDFFGPILSPSDTFAKDRGQRVKPAQHGWSKHREGAWSR